MQECDVMETRNAQTEMNLPSIVVIDDELGPRESLRMLFKDRYEVKCANSVATGLATVSARERDLLIMDIKMPGKNGIQGLQEIRSADPCLSIVMLTGFGALETAQAAIRYGASDYVTKPFDKDDMRAIASRNIRKTRLARRRVATVRDMEDLNARLQQERAQLEHLAELGQVSSEFLHDLSNPLVVVTNCVAILAMNLRANSGGGTAENLEHLEYMEKSTERCFQLIQRWRNFGSRVSDENMKPVAVQGLIGEIVTSMRPIAEAANAVVEMDNSDPDCMVLSDALEIGRAVQNVVSNAFHALPPKGGLVRVSWVESGDMVEVRVRDNGHGIPNDKLDQVFDPYYSTKKKTGGMGLGLFITRKVIEGHGGTIRLENNLDGGVTARIRLPIHK